jgi:signal peptidase I
MIKTRSPYIAFILSICPGLGQQYSGHIYRGILLYISLINVSWLSAIAFVYLESRNISFIVLCLPFITAIIIMLDAVTCAKKQAKSYQLKWFNKSWVYAGVFGTLVITINPIMDYLVGKNIVRAYLVNTESMSPEIMSHDIILINKLSSPDRYDIVLIRFDEKSQNDHLTEIIKDQTIRRIVGMPGDEIMIKGNNVFVNSQLITEKYATYNNHNLLNVFDKNDYTYGPEVVPDESYFILADAREYGLDSRMIGFIKRQNISGVVSKILWSWNFNDGTIKWERTAMTLRNETI